MEECKIMVHGEAQPMFGKRKESETHIGKRLHSVMDLMLYPTEMIHAMDMR